MNLDLSGAGAVTTNLFVILWNPEIIILHIDLMVTILVTNHRLAVIMLLPCTHHSGSIEVFCDTQLINSALYCLHLLAKIFSRPYQHNTRSI